MLRPPQEHGQVLVLAVVILFGLILGVMMLFDLHNAIRAKIKVETAQQAAALAGAGWQVEGLNLIGRINLIKACELMTRDDSDYTTPYDSVKTQTNEEERRKRDLQFRARVRTLTETQSRVAFIVPMLGVLAAQQTAKQNGMPANNRTFEYYVDRHLPLHDSRYIACNGYYWHTPVSRLAEQILQQGVAVRVNSRAADLPEVWSRTITGDFRLLLSEPDLYAAIEDENYCYWQLMQMAKKGVPATSETWAINYIDAPFVEESELFTLGVRFGSSDMTSLIRDTVYPGGEMPAPPHDRLDETVWCNYDAQWYPESYTAEAYDSDQQNWRRNRWLREDRRPGYLYEGPCAAVDNYIDLPRYNRTLAYPPLTGNRLLQGGGGVNDRTLGMHRDLRTTTIGYAPTGNAENRGVVAKPLGSFGDGRSPDDAPITVPMILPVFRQPTIVPSAMPYNLRMQTSGDDDLKRFLQWLAAHQSLDGVPPSGTESYREALLKLESKDYLNRIFNPDFSGVDLLTPRLLFTDLYKYPNDPSGAGWLQEAWLSRTASRPYIMVPTPGTENSENPTMERKYLVEENVVRQVTEVVLEPDGALRTYFGNDRDGYRYFLTRNGKILTNEDIACGQARHYPGGPGLPPGTNSGPPRL